MGLNECDSANPCPVHFIVVPFKNNILAKFRDLTIMEFSKEISDKGSLLTLKNVIPASDEPLG
jgi:hypothetical protein